jgi:acetate---CoA ligase (ADP-forming)
MLDNFFNPRSIAVVGASRAPGKVGFEVIKNLVNGGFDGKIYPVNPKASDVFGIKCLPAVKDIPGAVDLAVIAIPPKTIMMTLVELDRLGADSAIVITAGFKEIGPEGAELEKMMLAIAKEHKIRLLGPNCLGLIDTYSKVNASFAAGMPARGNIAFISQSGALCTAILDWSFANGIGFSKFISLGNKADIDEVDMLEALGEDENTKVIVGYLESCTRGPKFMEAAYRITRKKPIILIKSGVSEAGARAASSHTGSLAGSEAAFDAAFLQSGVLRARSVEELFDYAVAFSSQPLPAGNRLAIVTNAGGPGIMATDAAEGKHISLTTLKKETIDKLMEKLPPTASPHNPVDIIGDALADRYAHAVTTLIEDPEVDGLVVLLTPQGMTQIEETAKSIAYAALMGEKPILTAFMGQDMVASGVHILRKNRIPDYGFPERAVNVFSRMAEYAEWKKKPDRKPVTSSCDLTRAKASFEAMLLKEKTNVAGERALQIIEQAGLRIPHFEIAEDLEEAKQFAAKTGYPVVLKVSSPDISHKSDVGAVKVGIRDEHQLEEAYQQIMINSRRAAPNAIIYGIEVHQMITGGKEFVVGVNRDPQFGPLIMFGLGGIYVEVFKDVIFRIAPLSEDDIEDMIFGIKSRKLLTGARGEKPRDIPAVREVLRVVSCMVTEIDSILEMDINPLFVMEEGKGVYAVDARFGLKPDWKTIVYPSYGRA